MHTSLQVDIGLLGNRQHTFVFEHAQAAAHTLNVFVPITVGADN